MIAKLGLTRALDAKLPVGVTAHTREADGRRFVFVENYNGEAVRVELGDAQYADMLGGRKMSGNLDLEAYGAVVLTKNTEL